MIPANRRSARCTGAGGPGPGADPGPGFSNVVNRWCVQFFFDYIVYVFLGAGGGDDPGPGF